MRSNNDLQVGLALSGGGFRAALFGLGSLWRLNEAGLLGRLARITSVSGGSILASILAHRWRQLRFRDGRADNFDSVVGSPVREFCSHTIDISAALLGHLTPFKTTRLNRFADQAQGRLINWGYALAWPTWPCVPVRAFRWRRPKAGRCRSGRWIESSGGGQPRGGRVSSSPSFACFGYTVA